MTEKKTYLFGPVPSRRLGLSLGVDIVPFKVCSLDCVYCQLGRTTHKTCERAEFVPIEAVLDELKGKIDHGLKADYITLSGSGEPTLHSRFGELIDGIKGLTDIPVAVITNGTLLYLPAVRADCAKADLIVPSLDAVDDETFQKINRPNPDISIEKLVNGLILLRKEYAGPIWLEVFLIDSVNTTEEQIEKFAEVIGRIRPDKVQLNSVARPTAEAGISKISVEKMRKIAKKLEKLSINCEIIADFVPKGDQKETGSNVEDILSILRRRPCSADDICRGLSIHKNEAMKYLGELLDEGAIEGEEKNGVVFYKTTNARH